MAAVVAERDRFRQSDVESARLSDRTRYLRDLERMGEARPLMIAGEHEHLGLSGESAE